MFFFFSSRRRHTIFDCDWSSDVCSSDLVYRTTNFVAQRAVLFDFTASRAGEHPRRVLRGFGGTLVSDDYSGYFGLQAQGVSAALDRKSTRLNSSHSQISYAVFCLKKKKK